MTSCEIAELTGKQHAHVMRDIRTLTHELATNPELDSCVISTTYSGGDCRKLADFYAETYSPEKSGELVKTSTYTDSTGRELPCFDLGNLFPDQEGV